MLVGYNTNVTYKGNVYHVQTEDSGIKNPVIVTLLYLKGTILSSKKISYAHIANNPDYKMKVRELMKEQHKSMLKELVSGKFTSEKTSEEQHDEPPETKQEEPRPESTAEDKPARSLDDILLDYIIKRKD